MLYYYSRWLARGVAPRGAVLSCPVCEGRL